MYSSLDRSDFIVKTKDGMSTIVLTDHRSRSEIEAEADLSTVFAIIRVLNGARMGMQQGGPFKVRYTCQERPPEFLHQAIAAAGGILSIDNNQVPFHGHPPDLVTTLNGSIIRLARTISYRYDEDLTLKGLHEIERQYFASRPDPEGDEIAYWTAVVELGAVGGEVMRGFKGGRWNSSRHDFGTLPVVFECGPLVMNPLGKAIKFFQSGEEDSLAFMVQVSVAELDQMGADGIPSQPKKGSKYRKKGFMTRMFQKG